MAPTPGCAQGTTEPTARNFDWVATPHWRASGAQAAIEYVATSGLAIRELGEIEIEELGLRLGDEHRGDLGPGEGGLYVFCRLRADDDGPSRLMRLLERSFIGDVIENEGVVELQ